MKRTSLHMQALTSTISTTMVLVLLGMIVLFVLTAQRLSEQVRENLTVTVILQDDVASEDAHKLETELGTCRFVNEIHYISAQDALNEQIEMMGTDPTEFLGANPFSISMEVKMKAEYACNDSLEWIANQIKERELVSDVLYQQDLVEGLNKNLRRASLFLLVIAALLVIVSLSLINNTVRLSVYSKRFIIHTMKLVGARWGFIRRPFLVRSMGIGIISSVFAICILFFGVQWAATYDEAVGRYVTLTNMGIMAVCVLVFGLVITMLCTYLSVTHYLNLRENELY